jgi:hypothetical protein
MVASKDWLSATSEGPDSLRKREWKTSLRVHLGFVEFLIINFMKGGTLWQHRRLFQAIAPTSGTISAG